MNESTPMKSIRFIILHLCFRADKHADNTESAKPQHQTNGPGIEPGAKKRTISHRGIQTVIPVVPVARGGASARLVATPTDRSLLVTSGKSPKSCATPRSVRKIEGGARKSIGQLTLATDHASNTSG
ncbi:hypothetical protein GJAV_G00214940 [Gymnothorax javanicus]|nr:hypothetical protein GJAV_G00214940 [Gymnothorax javanicus]